jgi:septal ring factor EnvC (AmiA/AmiB activator)
LTPVVGDGYDRVRLRGGEPIPEALDSHDFKRLEQAIAALVDKHRRAQVQIAALRRELADCDRRIRGQQQEIRQLLERREEAVKRIDLLVAELDRLDGQLAAREA